MMGDVEVDDEGLFELLLLSSLVGEESWFRTGAAPLVRKYDGGAKRAVVCSIPPSAVGTRNCEVAREDGVFDIGRR